MTEFRHFGVLGMRWGVRKRYADQLSSGREFARKVKSGDRKARLLLVAGLGAMTLTAAAVKRAQGLHTIEKLAWVMGTTISTGPVYYPTR